MGGLENFSKVNKRGGDYSVLESMYNGYEIKPCLFLLAMVL